MVPNRSARHSPQKSYPMCRNRAKLSFQGAMRGGKASHEPSIEPVTHEVVGPEVQRVIALASRIASMSDHQVRERYHELVDRRPGLDALERFELGRIEARLDAEDRDPKLEARERQWQEERVALLDSVDKLLASLRSRSV